MYHFICPLLTNALSFFLKKSSNAFLILVHNLLYLGQFTCRENEIGLYAFGTQSVLRVITKLSGMLYGALDLDS